ncbi:MAG: hypothetical protein CMJ46_08610, partial [Planctomyces sp.]|nr:hypothetical protein [Planctomyces sp.]
MDCYLTQTAAWLPGDAVENDQIDRYLGTIASEELVRDTVLAMNGIKRRHYAQNEHQEATEDIYSMATRAAELCLRKSPDIRISYLTAGTTFAPLTAPGIASIIHDRLSERGHLKHSIEISSHSGICSSSATALVSAIRAVRAGEHAAVLSIGAEHPSDKLKSTVLHPPDDRDEHENIQHSQWFMSVFLRFMLSDGAGAFLLQN